MHMLEHPQTSHSFCSGNSLQTHQTTKTTKPPKKNSGKSQHTDLGKATPNPSPGFFYLQPLVSTAAIHAYMKRLVWSLGQY
mmetsp:Transcript_29280/g.52659  ORF Transcript_29280/g.52659 Transcript_29280/m.52659 type:complete len:81 (-) Transcript_29280:603-845(-)